MDKNIFFNNKNEFATELTFVPLKFRLKLQITNTITGSIILINTKLTALVSYARNNKFATKHLFVF